MLKSSQFTRSAVIAATMISVAASPAVARQADMPAARHAVAAGAITARHWTQPRVDSTGIRPVGSPAAVTAPAPAVPVTRPSDGNGGLQWLLIPLAALILAFTLIIAVARAGWHATDTFRARHV